MNETIDLVDEDDQLTGKTAKFEEIMSKKLWHRGVHIIICTPDGEVVMQKRSPKTRMYPGKVEVGVGGGVDAGEDPEAAIIREVKEELGIIIPKEKLKFLGKKKWNYANLRVFVYSYSAIIPKIEINFKLNPSEVTEAFLMPIGDLKRDVEKHTTTKHGELSPIYSFWKYLLDNIS